MRHLALGLKSSPPLLFCVCMLGLYATGEESVSLSLTNRSSVSQNSPVQTTGPSPHNASEAQLQKWFTEGCCHDSGTHPTPTPLQNTHFETRVENVQHHLLAMLPSSHLWGRTQLSFPSSSVWGRIRPNCTAKHILPGSFERVSALWFNSKEKERFFKKVCSLLCETNMENRDSQEAWLVLCGMI